MKIRAVLSNSRKNAFEIRTAKQALQFPYARCDPRPTKDDPVIKVYVDKEIGREGIMYVLRSGREGAVHVEQALEYNRDPAYMRDLLLYKLTVEAQKRLEISPLSRREIIRRLRTSATQFYRLIDQTNYRKSIDQMVALLNVLDCDVDLVVRAKPTAHRAAA
jgi:hypothetical protein